ncbi:MAG: glycosyltransferase family 4 protein [Parachlamydiaceae bacterium]|nr:glycosyltransferase family 4 protein [Parachlamydiaceae bacterium]
MSNKVGFVVYNEYPGLLPSGGIGVFVKNLTEGMVQNNLSAEVLLIVEDIPIMKNKEINGVPIHILHIKNASNPLKALFNKLTLIRKIEQIVKEREIDILEISTSDTFLMRPVKNTTVLARTHGSLSYALKNYYKNIGFVSKWIQLRHEKVLLKQAKHIIAISNQYFEHYTKYKDKLLLIENFIGPEYYQSQKGIIHKGKPYIFFHGTLKDIKGVKELANAFVLSGLGQDYDLVMAGKTSANMLTEIKNICGDCFIYLGECNSSRLIVYLQNASLCVYPSKRDAFNLAVVEAMSQGSLVLVSDAIDAHIIQNGKNGFRFPTWDFKNLGSYIKQCLELCTENKMAITANAKYDVEQKYSYLVGIRNNAKLYNNLLNYIHEN